MPPYYTSKDTIALLTKIPRPSSLTEPVLYARLKTLLVRPPRSNSRLLSAIKYVVYVVLLVNCGSWPFVWHLRTYWPILMTRIESWVLQLKLVFAPEKKRTRALVRWLEGISPVGVNPFEIGSVCSRWASIDDIDMFGFHLSNSSYAKAYDAGRAKAFMEWFPTWVLSGGQVPLGATHYHFLREISPFARYEIRLSIASWDNKWMYIIARFVTRPGRRHATHLSPQSSTPPTPNDAYTPTQNGPADVEQAVAAIINPGCNGTASARRTPIVESDGAILHCIAVSHICFKRGRITVPPAIVLASEGFTKPCDDGDVDESSSSDSIDTVHSARSYSRADPPPNWIESQSLRASALRGMDPFLAFVRGAWRDVAEGERWWEDALGGSIEARRRANLEILESLKVGLERVRTVHEKHG